MNTNKFKVKFLLFLMLMITIMPMSVFASESKDATSCNKDVNNFTLENYEENNVTYDRETHIGESFSIKVYSTASQTYVITCSNNIEFSSRLISASMIFTDQLYYAKEYEITVNEPGSFLFYVKGSMSSNTLTYTVKINDHNFDSKWTIDKEATCTENGSKYHKCTVCDATTDVTVIEKLGHDYSTEWTIDKKATCTENGSKSRHCSRCDDTTEVTIIDALSTTGHQYSEEWTIDKEATCTETGSKSHHCTVCDERTEITEIKALGHTWVKSYIESEPTYENEGIQIYECKKCKITKKENIPALERKEISSVTLNKTLFEFNGKRQVPTVVVKANNTILTENIDYEVQYGVGEDNMIGYGSYPVIVTGIGEYTGQIIEYFYIAENPFTDIKSDQYYFEPIIWAYPNITSGIDATHFAPDAQCTRAQVVTFLWRSQGCPTPTTLNNPFMDIPADTWYTNAVLWAYENQVTMGMSATTFAPNATVTRAQFVTFLWRLEDEENVSINNPFVDIPNGQYYTNAVLWAYKNGITSGTSANTFSPNNPCLRGQVVTFLYRAYGN